MSWAGPQEGRFITHADCRNDAGKMRCGGPTLFLDPDTGKTDRGPGCDDDLADRGVPLVQDVFVDVDFRGPLEFRHSFVIDPDVKGQLTDIGANGGKLRADSTDGGTQFEVNLQSQPSGSAFVTGSCRSPIPSGGIDRTFMVLGHAFLVGVRVFSHVGHVDLDATTSRSPPESSTWRFVVADASSSSLTAAVGRQIGG